MNQYRTATIPIFTIGEMKRMAKKQLSGKWLRLLPLMLIYTLLTTVPAVVIQLNSYMTQTSQLNSMLASDNVRPHRFRAGAVYFSHRRSLQRIFIRPVSENPEKRAFFCPYYFRRIYTVRKSLHRQSSGEHLLRALGSSLHSSGQLLSGNGHRFRQPDSRLLILHGIYRAFVSGCHFSHALPDDFLHRGR